MFNTSTTKQPYTIFVKKKWFSVWYTVLCLLLVLIIFPELGELSGARQELNSNRIESVSGHGYQIPIVIDLPWYLEVIGDSANAPRKSQLKLYEDGTRLRLEHSLHRQIREEGKGRFSHWGSFLIFSSTDNSNPATNGRKYEFEYVPSIRTSILSYGLIIIGVILLLNASISVGAADTLKLFSLTLSFGLLVCIIREIYLVNSEFHILGWPLCATPDSASYLTADPIRTPGYPIFLRFVNTIFGGLHRLPIVQLNIYFAASAITGFAISKLTNSTIAGLLLCLALIRSSVGTYYAIFVLSESLFVTVIVLHLAALASYLHLQRNVILAIAGFLLAIAIQVRPVAIALLPCFVFVAALVPRWNTWRVGQALVPVVAVYIASGLFNWYQNDTFESQSLTGYALLGHVVHLDREQLDENGEIVMRKRIQAAAEKITVNIPDPDFSDSYRKLTADNFNRLGWGTAVRVLRDDLKTYEPTLSEDAVVVKVNKSALELSLQIIVDYPVNYVKHVLSHFIGMWKNVITRHKSSVEVAETCDHAATVNSIPRSVHDEFFSASEGNYQTDFTNAAKGWHLDRKPYSFERKYRSMFRVLLFVISVIAFVLACFLRFDGTIAFMLHLSLSTWLYYLLVSMFQPAIFRYADAFEPVQWVMLISLFGFLLDSIKPKLKTLF